jgi:crotonobetainyl-CoA:carnitine CoA-transferase CaiB-like acyl-CoA transferase
VSVTGYGRSGPAAHWVAFGDDAAVAAGLAAATGGPDAPLFCGDAIADPLTGLHAAVAALASQRRGGGELLDLSLRDVVAHALAFGSGAAGPGGAAADDAEMRRLGRGWEVAVGGASAPVLPPRARRIRARARPLGADTRAVLGGLRSAAAGVAPC